MFTRIFIALILSLPLCVHAQQVVDSFYLDNNNQPVSPEDATYIRVVQYRNIFIDSAATVNHYIDSVLRRVESYSNYAREILEGPKTYYSDSGTVEIIENYTDNMLDGELITYYPTGKLKRKDVYKMNELVEGHVYDPRGRETEYFPYIVEAEFPGGMDELQRQISSAYKYPKRMRKRGIEGRTMVGFVVNQNGEITEVKVIQSSGQDELDQAAVQAVKSVSSRFSPLRRDGKVMRSYITIPMRAELQ